jgi:hypothetical protein
MYRPHYELVANKKRHQLPSGKYNTWYAIMMLYASIFNQSATNEKKNAEKARKPYSLESVKSIYGDYPCSEGVDFIFGRYLERLAQMNLFEAKR